MKKSSVFGGNNEVISIKLNFIAPSLGFYLHPLTHPNLLHSPPMEENLTQPLKIPIKQGNSR
jgi:hypothetical protein